MTARLPYVTLNSIRNNSEWNNIPYGIKMSRKKDEYRVEIGKRIKQVRLAAKMNQQDFAELLETSQPTINRLETGSRMAEVYIVKRIAEEFGCEIDWLVNGDKGPYKKGPLSGGC